MKLCYTIEQKHAEKFISFLIVGVLYSLEKKIISIDEAEGFIFQPDEIKSLKKINASRELIDIIEGGCQLEDVESLIPEKLPKNIRELLQETLSVIRNNKEIGRLVEKVITVKSNW
ncbi:hypothetical protein Xvie_03938 [Xenorhabdus vietnamensis]|uniref:DUF3969 family protein n=1 Tax=Xenorhabdus vietnamensis TaxID=351656 RepID=A0A1Y2S8B5_9GAMM|nr:DUF3969 family protein [Xenorhabdus vietnamensis]OTA14160.1 hypothetical protein Xvie_03938 [Xenorhabdus vietnamensis]